MRGYIRWSSVSCGSQEHEQGKLRIATSAFGTSYIALLFHFLRLRKCVNIHFFCEDCLHMRELKEIEISRVEVETKEHEEVKARTRQEWLVWISSAQYKQLKKDFRPGGRICLLFPLKPCHRHQGGHTRLLVTALPITSDPVKTKLYGYVEGMSWTHIRS